MKPETNSQIQIELLAAMAELERARAAKWSAVSGLLKGFGIILGTGISVLALVFSLL